MQLPETGYLAWGWYIPQSNPDRADWLNVNADEGVFMFSSKEDVIEALSDYYQIRVWEVDTEGNRPIGIRVVTEEIEDMRDRMAEVA